jgi:hypothetical protein
MIFDHHGCWREAKFTQWWCFFTYHKHQNPSGLGFLMSINSCYDTSVYHDKCAANSSNKHSKDMPGSASQPHNSSGNNQFSPHESKLGWKNNPKRCNYYLRICQGWEEKLRWAQLFMCVQVIGEGSKSSSGLAQVGGSKSRSRCFRKWRYWLVSWDIVRVVS